ncbi:MAG TPA: malto-oligosyltrehalose synthase [Gammaproteobacteria bacterium]|nr:malto-oligosyltrehalose synthase [Gammaproteobacteria bacterium]
MTERTTTPLATYRLQFNHDFTFADAERLVPYLAELGISHVYASPWLKARAGSLHGYDIIDHNEFNPEVGSARDFERLSRALDQHGLGHILDFVPNHMGIAEADNEWWLDVLEWGRASPYADYFDIDWNPTDPHLRNKVLLPFLGNHYGQVLEAGDLQPRFDADNGAFSVWYFEHRFPVAPRDYALLIRAGTDGGDAPVELATLAEQFAGLRVSPTASARRVNDVRRRAEELKARLATLAAGESAARASIEAGLAGLAGHIGEPESFRALHRLLERQAYRLAYWRVAADEINYRRFFDINDLAGIRIENPTLFDAAHRLVGRLLNAGQLDGLRLDHIDGLFDPGEYCRRLAGLVDNPFYISVEKILAHHEHLRDWPVAGTTGYDFMNQVNAFLVDPHGEAAMTRTYRHFIGREIDLGELAYRGKKQVIDTKLSSELHVLARDLNRIAERHWNTRDYTLESLTAALREVVACFPVYRTYVDTRGASADDRRDIGWAVAQARHRWEAADDDIFAFIEAALTTDLVREPGSGYNRRQVLRFAMKFQQYTSPVMAKGFEDTALYRYNRLIGLNEVGGDPAQFGISVAAFHHANTERAEHWPHAQLTTATHDTKRGEDVRARLAIVAAAPEAWEQHVRLWARYNRHKKQPIDERAAPDREDEYLLYQTLVGAWPVEMLDADWSTDAADNFIGRVQGYMHKAIREAKRNSSWTNPNEAYEQAIADFVARILDPAGSRLFLDDFVPFAHRTAEAAVDASLVQLTLKLTCPGIPDVYQGGELWDLNLVDPDNRRPVDFEVRRRLLAEVKRTDELQGAERVAALRDMRAHWRDGRIKLFVLHKLLQLRRHYPQVFSGGAYTALEADGPRAGRICAFVRTHESCRIMVIVARPRAEAGGWAEAVLQSEPGEWREVVRDQPLVSAATIELAELFDTLPAAVLINDKENRCTS